MKKLLVLTVSFLLALGCSHSALAARSGDVMRLTNGETAEFRALLDKDPQSMDDFFRNAGILVVTGEGEEPPVNLEADFHLAVQAGEDSGADEEDPGLEIAELYYRHEGVFVVRSVYAAGGSTQDREALIERALEEARAHQAQPLEEQDQGGWLGERVYTYLRPEGEMTVFYAFHTVQERNEKDYYTVTAKVEVTPGCALGDSDAEGLSLDVSLSTSTTSVVIDDYGPLREGTTKGVSVEIGW